MELRIDDAQLDLILQKIYGKPKKGVTVEFCLKSVQLVLLVLAALWAFYLNMKFDFADKEIAAHVSTVEAQITEVEFQRQQAALQKDIEEQEARARQVLAESDHGFTFKAVEPLGGKRYKWSGVFKLKLTNNKLHDIKVRYSVFDVFVGTVDPEFLQNGSAILINPPPSVFTYVRSGTETEHSKIAPIDWSRELCIVSTILTPTEMAADSEAATFFKSIKPDRLKHSDQLLVGNLRPGESSYVEVEFAFNARVGDYIGASCVYGMDEEFSEKEHRHFIPFFELTSS